MALESHIQREDENDVCSWDAKPKWHLAEHFFDLAWEGHNPKDFWNYPPCSSGHSEGVGREMQAAKQRRPSFVS